MAEPRPDQIAEAAVAALRLVRQASGYYTDLGERVSRRRWQVTQIDRTKVPCASVWMGAWKRVDGKCLGSNFGSIVRVLQVDLWTQSGSPDDVDRDGLRAEADAMRAVLSTGCFGLSFVTLLEPMKGSSDCQEFGDRGIGFRAMSFAVTHKEAASGPTL